MHWIYYYLLPLIVAWKKRSADTAEEVFALYGTMFGTFLAIWLEPLVSESLSTLIPPDFKMLKPWISAISIAAVTLVAVVVFKKVSEKIAPDGLDSFVFPEKITKFLVPCVVFLHTGLVCAMLFTVLSVTPLVKYAPFIFRNESLCSSTRYRMLWNTFLIDRFSMQPSTITLRRRAFDRFVPEKPGEIQSPAAPRSPKRKAK